MTSIEKDAIKLPWFDKGNVLGPHWGDLIALTFLLIPNALLRQELH